MAEGYVSLLETVWEKLKSDKCLDIFWITSKSVFCNCILCEHHCGYLYKGGCIFAPPPPPGSATVEPRTLINLWTDSLKSLKCNIIAFLANIWCELGSYNNPAKRKIHLWKKAKIVSLCEHITYLATSFDARYTHRSSSYGPHSLIKSSKWWPTAFHWNGPPPDIVKPGRTQISNGLPNVKRRRLQNIDLVRETNTKTTWSGLKNRWSRKAE